MSWTLSWSSVTGAGDTVSEAMVERLAVMSEVRCVLAVSCGRREFEFSSKSIHEYIITVHWMSLYVGEKQARAIKMGWCPR